MVENRRLTAWSPGLEVSIHPDKSFWRSSRTQLKSSGALYAVSWSAAGKSSKISWSPHEKSGLRLEKRRSKLQTPNQQPAGMWQKYSDKGQPADKRHRAGRCWVWLGASHAWAEFFEKAPPCRTAFSFPGLCSQKFVELVEWSHWQIVKSRDEHCWPDSSRCDRKLRCDSQQAFHQGHNEKCFISVASIDCGWSVMIEKIFGGYYISYGNSAQALSNNRFRVCEKYRVHGTYRSVCCQDCHAGSGDISERPSSYAILAPAVESGFVSQRGLKSPQGQEVQGKL